MSNALPLNDFGVKWFYSRIQNLKTWLKLHEDIPRNNYSYLAGLQEAKQEELVDLFTIAELLNISVPK